MKLDDRSGEKSVEMFVSVSKFISAVTCKFGKKIHTFRVIAFTVLGTHAPTNKRVRNITLRVRLHGVEIQQGQQRVAVLDMETRVSFLFARCRPMQPCHDVDPSVDLNYVPADRAGTVVCSAAAAALLLILHSAIC